MCSRYSLVSLESTASEARRPWAVILGIVVLVYKLAPPLRMRYELVLSAALVALGGAYLMMA